MSYVLMAVAIFFGGFGWFFAFGFGHDMGETGNPSGVVLALSVSGITTAIALAALAGAHW